MIIEVICVTTGQKSRNSLNWRRGKLSFVCFVALFGHLWWIPRSVGAAGCEGNKREDTRAAELEREAGIRLTEGVRKLSIVCFVALPDHFW